MNSQNCRYPDGRFWYFSQYSSNRSFCGDRLDFDSSAIIASPSGTTSSFDIGSGLVG
ncbi:unnamed protein product [Acidithrix sp. C25]|nr:unnamed protein product [Acidithrix sp. C25]